MAYTPMQRFFRMLQPNRREILHLYFFAFINGLVLLSIPLGIQSIINLIQGGEISAAWILLVAIVLFGYIFAGIIQIIQLKITEHLQKDIFARSAFDLAFRIPKMKKNVLYNHYAPELINRFFDTITIQKGLAKVLIDFTAAAFQILFGLLLISFYHPFFIIFSAMVILLFYLIGNYVFHRGLRSSLVESSYKYKVAFWLEEIARVQDTFKLSSHSTLAIKKTDGLVESYLGARQTHFNVLLRQYYLFIVYKVFVVLGFLLLGGILVFNQQMNIGQFVAAEIIIILLISSTEKILLSLETIYDLLTSTEKLGQVTDIPLETSREDTIQPDVNGEGLSVIFRNVYFKYPDSDIYNLKDINFSIKAGERVCITGTNGSGKATLVQLLNVFYEIDQGSILFNDIPVTNYNIDRLRSLIAECVSHGAIFDGTIMENLTMGQVVSYDKLMDVLNNLGLTEYIRSMPMGFETLVGPKGTRLPGSVFQKMILARNLLKSPKLIVIEDLFRNLEKEEKLRIFNYIFDQRHRWTVIIVTRDKDLIALSEKVIVMDSGTIREIKEQ
jgi:ABC-type bacteriocin/lantibiotic exporter with double-glycine peptidase domain